VRAFSRTFFPANKKRVCYVRAPLAFRSLGAFFFLPLLFSSSSHVRAGVTPQGICVPL